MSRAEPRRRRGPLTQTRPMSNTVHTRAPLLAAATAIVLAAACGGSGTPTEPQSGAASVEVTNATNFHLLDFVGWNNHDLDVFRRLHTADVKVNFGGNQTAGIDAHVQALEPAWQPGALITQHSTVIAEGEWTCMVGTIGPSAKMVTVAKWRDGAISEEYILTNLLATGTAKPAVSGAPVASISNRNAELKRQVGAEPGWSCVFERTADAKMVISVSKAGGTAAEQMVFTQ